MQFKMRWKKNLKEIKMKEEAKKIAPNLYNLDDAYK